MATSDTCMKFRTTDMVLATLLYMDGLEYVHELELHSRKGMTVRNCAWVFDAPEHPDDKKDFDSLLARFEDGKCKVEPREFARTWADVRRSMGSFLGWDRAGRR